MGKLIKAKPTRSKAWAQNALQNTPKPAPRARRGRRRGPAVLACGQSRRLPATLRRGAWPRYLQAGHRESPWMARVRKGGLPQWLWIACERPTVCLTFYARRPRPATYTTFGRAQLRGCDGGPREAGCDGAMAPCVRAWGLSRVLMGSTRRDRKRQRGSPKNLAGVGLTELGCRRNLGAGPTQDHNTWLRCIKHHRLHRDWSTSELCEDAFRPDFLTTPSSDFGPLSPGAAPPPRTRPSYPKVAQQFLATRPRKVTRGDPGRGELRSCPKAVQIVAWQVAQGAQIRPCSQV